MNKKRMNALLGSVTALCMTCTTMSNAIVFAQENTFEVINENSTATSGPNWEEAKEDETVFYNGEYFNNTQENDCDGALEKALIAAFKDKTTSGVKEIHCRPGKDVGKMTHGHVADDLIIYGNGAYVSDGERDLEIDTNKFDRTTGAQSQSGQFLEKDITVTVKELNGIAAWGERHTTHNVTLKFENCKNMQRVYITMVPSFNGPVGDVNIDLKNCSFVGNEANKDDKSYPYANQGTTIYSNYNGTINVENCEFKNVDLAFNMNHKKEGTQTISVKDSMFNNCGQAKVASKTYTAPIRVVASVDGSQSNLSVENCEFTYTEGKTNCGNGDILIGDGRSNETSDGTVNLSMSKTQANVMAQKPGYYGANGNVANKDNATTTTVEENEVVKNQGVEVGQEISKQPATDSGSGSGGGVTQKLSKVYRAYNPNNGEHLYTLDEKEYKHVTSIGWQAEDVAFMAEEEKNGQALYRVYNPNSGLHHYTLDENEKNTLVSLGWHDEKVAWYTSKKPQSAPVFRVYNPNDGNHHYTMNKQEKDALVLLGWHDEGLAFRTAPIEK